MKLLLIPILFISISVNSLELVLEQGDHFGGYQESFYIKDGEALYFRKVFVDPSKAKTKDHMPVWKSVALTKESEEIISSIVLESKITKWKEQYPESWEGLICDGLGYGLYVQIGKKGFKSEGACETPQNYTLFVQKLREFFNVQWKPNK